MTKAAVAAVALLALLPTAGVTLTAGLVTAAASTAPCGPAGPARDVAGTPLDAEQLANAQTIIGVTADRHLPSTAGILVARNPSGDQQDDIAVRGRTGGDAQPADDAGSTMPADPGDQAGSLESRWA